MAIDAIGPTKPAHGVIATSPATATDAAPSIAVDAASVVFMNAWAAMPLAASAEPALNPNQPNQSRPVPSNVSGSECGGVGWLGHPRRRPMTITATSAAIPALMWTTVPPAKSSAPRRNSHPAGEKTQCATGVYTMSAHSPTNHTHAENRMRSAMAPVMSAGVMMANIIWNAENDSGGIG